MPGPISTTSPKTAHNCDAAEQYISERLEFAGRTLLSLPSENEAPAGLKSSWPAYARAAIGDHGSGKLRAHPPAPTARAIAMMDEAFDWIGLIAGDEPRQRIRRRLIWSRALCHPISGKHLFSWRKLAKMTGLAAN